MTTQLQPTPAPGPRGLGWRLAFALASAAGWAIWFLLANRGQPFHLLPTGDHLREMHGWFHWWGISWIKFIPFVGDIALCIIVGSLVFPWGLSITLSALVLPALSLIRPARDWGLDIAISVYDFCWQRLIYVFVALCLYTDALLPEVAPVVGSWATPILRVIYGLSAVYLGWRYLAFVRTSIRVYDPFATDDKPSEPSPAPKEVAGPQ